MALWIPPALAKAQGKLRSPAPRADFRRMKMAPKEPSLGPALRHSDDLGEADASKLMLSLASSSMLRTLWRDRSKALSGQGYREGGPEGGRLKLLNRNTGTEFSCAGLER